MSIEQTKFVVSEAARLLKKEIGYLSDLDAMTGDGDHGVTIGKLSDAIIDACGEVESDATLGELFDALFVKTMEVNGGCAGSLWAQMFSGISEVAADAKEVTPDLLRGFYRGALTGLYEISSAKAGEKTMLDALIPAAKAAELCPGGVCEILSAAAKAAGEGAEATRQMSARYGRAKHLKDSTGYLDPGAVSLSFFMQALARSCGQLNGREDREEPDAD